MLSEIFIVILGVIIILLIVYIYVKEQDNNRKFKLLASKIDNANRQIFTLGKNVGKELENQKREIQNDLSSFLESDSNRYSIDTSELDHFRQVLERTLYEVEDLKGLNSRILTLETGMKNAVLNRNSSVDKTQQIVSFYKQGYSIEDISRELHISRTEVEFALKLARISL
jgi:conjugal transfer/entry exclusion protein